MSTEIHDVAAGRLRAQGQRYTTGRRKLVSALVDAGQPMAIPDLLEKDRAVAQSSAYRDLEAAGTYDSVRLFEARAAAAQRGFDLPRHLDAVIDCVDAVAGLPLRLRGR